MPAKMKTLFIALGLFACGPSSVPCVSSYENLTEWKTIINSGDTVSINGLCSTHAVFHLNTVNSAYLNKMIMVSAGQSINLYSEFDTTCIGGSINLLISEANIAVASQLVPLAAKTDNVGWTTDRATSIGFLFAAQVSSLNTPPCDVGMMLMTTVK